MRHFALPTPYALGTPVWIRIGVTRWDAAVIVADDGRKILVAPSLESATCYEVARYEVMIRHTKAEGGAL